MGVFEVTIILDLLDAKTKQSMASLAQVSADYNVFPLFYNRFDEIKPFSEQRQKTFQDLDSYLKYNPEAEKLLKSKYKLELERASLGRDLNQRSIFLEAATVLFCDSIYKSAHMYIGKDMRGSRVVENIPSLDNKITEGCLIQVDNEVILNRGSIRFKGHGLYYHQFLRRYYSSNPNFDFIEYFIGSMSPNNTYEIAIDPLRIADPTYMFIDDYYEKDYWHGSKFDPTKLFNPKYEASSTFGPGLRRPFSSVNYIEVDVKNIENGIKRFQLEEISDPLTPNCGEYYLQKYVHADIDMASEKIIHLDGAVIAHTKDSLTARTQRKYSFKDCSGIDYRKMFKIDGSIGIGTWANLITYYFRGNDLVFDCFEQENTD